MSDNEEMITDINVPIVHKYNFTAGASTTRFLSQLKKGVLTGQRCPSCSNVTPRFCNDLSSAFYGIG